MPWPVYSGQKTTCRNQLSPSTIFRENNPIPQNRVLTQAHWKSAAHEIPGPWLTRLTYPEVAKTGNLTHLGQVILSSKTVSGSGKPCLLR